MSQTIDFDRWIMYGSGWEVSFVAQLENLTVTRNYGSDYATVSGKAWIKSVGGSTNTKAKMRIQIGGTYQDVNIAGSNASGGWYTYWAGDWYGQTFSFNAAVGATSGTLTGNVYFRANDINGPQADSATKSYSQTYGTKGASTISSATNVTLSTSGSVVSTVKFVSYSSSFRHRFRTYYGGAWGDWSDYISGQNSQTITAGVSIPASAIDRITTATSATCTIYLYTYSGSTEIGHSSKAITMTLPSGINPTVAFTSGFPAKSAITSNPFTVPVINLDGIRVKWSYTPWKAVSTNSGSALNSGTVTVGSRSWSDTSGDKTSTVLTVYGSRTVSVTATDKRGNSGDASTTIDVYEYFYPSVTAQYRKSGSDYTLILKGKYASVNEENTTRNLKLDIYKNGAKVNQTDIDLSSYISTTVTTGSSTPYNDYYAVSGTYTLNITDVDGQGTDISDITTDTYEFRIISTDRLGVSQSYTVFSGITVMSLEAGGTGVVMRKPVEFEQGIRTNNADSTLDGLELLPLGVQNVGGKIKFDRGTSTELDGYIDVYNNQIRFHNGTTVFFGIDLNPPCKMYMNTSTLTSTNDLSNYTDWFMDAWCNNVQSKPSGSGQYGRVLILPWLQVYFEYNSNLWYRLHVNNQWYAWHKVVPST